MEELKIGKYRHFKGKEYQVLGIAKHSETLEEYVFYKQLYGDFGLRVRLRNNFFEIIEREGKTMPRFEYIES